MNTSKKYAYDPKKDIPNLSGKVILVTGGTSGLGRETVQSFAAHDPAHIYFTGRSQSSADEVAAEAAQKHPSTPVTFIQCDLASLASVQSAAKQFLARESRLHILNANAGIMALPPGLTKDGYELQFGTNHVGHALLVKLLTPVMTSTAEEGHDVRVVWDTSLAHKFPPTKGIDFENLKTNQKDISYFLAPWFRYGQSKLANLLYARAYAEHNPLITSVSIHPGVSSTGLVTGLSFAHRAFIYATSYLAMVPVEICAYNQQWAATARLGPGKREVESGTYYEPIGLKGSLTKMAGNEELTRQLWEWTQKELEPWAL